jgi:hypothetical protein
MEFCEICSIRHIVHKDIRFEEIIYKPTFGIRTTTKNVCNQCLNEWKKLVPDTSRRFDIVQKLLDGKIIREEDYKGPNYDYDKDKDR